MNEEAAFLTAMRAAPNDETVRLVYADWLDERDDPRAAIVRSEVEIGRMERDPFDAYLLAVTRKKFAYRGWRRKYPQRWVEAVSRTVSGEFLYTLLPQHDGTLHRTFLVADEVSEGLCVVDGGAAKYADKEYAVRCMIEPLVNPTYRPLALRLLAPWRVVRVKNALVPAYELYNAKYVFWDGGGIGEEDAALFSNP